MILKKLTLNPFAGIINKAIDFNSGLNIFLGANEAGKSTVVKSILALLFIKPASGKREKEIFKNYLPVGGGDTIKAVLEFSVNDADYSLNKSWGNNNTTELTLSDGTILAKYESIDKKIREFLQLSRLTYENVLVVNQNKLTSTIEDINNLEIRNDLTQILRTALFETGGVSVDKFKELIDNKESDYYNNWDRSANRPRGNKDFNDQWIKGNGLIVKSYYKYRELENDLKKIEEYEFKIDEYNRNITELTDICSKLSLFISGNKKTYEDSSKRELFESKAQNNKEQTKSVNEAVKNWPKIESDLEHQTTTKKNLDDKIKELNIQKIQALDIESKKYRADKYLRIRNLYVESDENNERLKTLTKVTADDVKKCNGIKRKIDNLSNKLEAQKLYAKISAKTDMAGKVTLGTEDAKQFSLLGGESQEEIANGRFIYENESMRIEVTSGNENIEDIINKLNAEKNEFDKLLKSFKIDSIESLDLLEETYKAQINTISNLKSRIKDELGEDTIEGLEIIYNDIQNTKVHRTSNELSEDILKLSNELAVLKEQIKVNNNLIANYTKEFLNKDSLIDKLVILKTEAIKLGEELSGLSPLPEGYSDSVSFIEQYNNSKTELDNKKDELSGKREELLDYEKNDPKKSQKDVDEDLRDAKKEFNKRIEEGDAILLIKETIINTLASAGDTYKPLQDAVNKYLNASMNIDNCDIKLDELNAKSLTRANKEIPVGLLSTGTKDLLGLILRLSMAEFYLKDNKGFLIMDDPLVNLDPQRQLKAVELIKEFSKEKQIIIMTCHPRHAELFNTNVMEL
ncbi:MAG: AAA family ATPase [Ignavibacteriae bacterium]|nr:AAA family ATPase [Ignavibacteriota bacterium]